MRFWRAREKGDLAEAQEIVFKYEIPFFNRWSHAFWRATFECFGVAGWYQRPPPRTIPASRLAGVQTFYRGLRLL